MWSLLRRHGNALSSSQGNAREHAAFFEDISLAAKMWVAYNRRILALLENESAIRLCVTQRSIVEGFELLASVRQHLGLAVNEAPSGIKRAETAEAIPAAMLKRLPAKLVDEMDQLWAAVRAFAHGSSANDVPSSDKDLPDKSSEPASLAAAHGIKGVLDGDTTYDRHHSDIENSTTIDANGLSTRLALNPRSGPKEWLAYYRMCAAHGRLDDASDSLMQLCERTPQPLPRLLLAKCLVANFRDEEAETLFLSVLQQNVKQVEAYASLARLWISQGRFEQASDLINTALSEVGPNTRILRLQNLINQPLHQL